MILCISLLSTIEFMKKELEAKGFINVNYSGVHESGYLFSMYNRIVKERGIYFEATKKWNPH